MIIVCVNYEHQNDPALGFQGYFSVENLAKAVRLAEWIIEEPGAWCTIVRRSGVVINLPGLPYHPGKDDCSLMVTRDYGAVVLKTEEVPYGWERFDPAVHI